MLLGSASRGRIVATQVIDAPTGLARFFALRRTPPADGRALRVPGPGFWASFAKRAVDVIFLDAKGIVVGVVPGLRPWSAAGPFERATTSVVLELGTCAEIPVEVGDRLELTPTTGERVAAGATPPMH